MGFFGTYLYDGAAGLRTGPVVAEDLDPAEVDLDDEEDDEVDDSEVFVEVKTARFLTGLGRGRSANPARLPRGSRQISAPGDAA